MRVEGRHLRTIWADPGAVGVSVLDQRLLPHRVEVRTLRTCADAVDAIRDMVVRGAPLIGVTAAYGLALQTLHDPADAALEQAAQALVATRPTAVNLAWAVRRMQSVLHAVPPADRAARAWTEAARLADDDVAVNQAIGAHGLGVLQGLAQNLSQNLAQTQPAHRRAGPLNILTHCNAGWLATVDGGTALAPIYHAQAAGLDVHVWVDETRPRNQGASITAWELAQQGVPHTVISDNAGGHLMQHGQVDVVIVGCDRVTARGDVCNKIGTYLKALAAHDNGIPFYAAMPLSTLDLQLSDGLREIAIEHRSAREQTHITGRDAAGALVEVQLTPDGSAALNPAFDVTPARLVTGLITERGVVPAQEAAMRAIAAGPA